MGKANLLRRQGEQSRLAPEEERLLRQINRGFSEEWWDNFHKLVSKREKRVLNSAEHDELLKLSDELEEREAKRLKALTKLAKFRSQTLADVMQSLGISRKTKSDG